jgi:uncharacterized protein (DUF1684 family)
VRVLERAFKSLPLLVPLAMALGCSEEPAASDAPPFDETAWRAEVDAWFAERFTKLRQPDGWLSLVGLYFLEEGESSFGSDAANTVVFPGNAPPRLGVFEVGEATGSEAPAVRVRAEPGAGLTHDGAAVSEMELATDLDGDPTLLEVGPLLFHAIDRDGRIGIRLKDRSSPLMAAFDGIDRFPLDPAFRVEARFEPYDPPKEVMVPNIIGPPLPDIVPGRLVFELAGETRSVEPTMTSDGRYFIVFGDATNGKQTYGGGRFVYADGANEAGTTVVDFNLAYNPPCVFTPFATCPLPTAENKLTMPIPAGEMAYHGPMAEGTH